mgnify:CR=1 FL=1
MVNTRKNSCGNIRTGSLANGKRVRRPERAPGPGLKPQDNNASFEGISEAEYNKRHMKALKDADPGLKPQASSTKRQAFEPTCSSAKRQASSPK